jgi:glycosyltransferase involved in cell wall biosynthesis
MQICHVTPHLPPDQAANALLPAELANWAARNGHQVTMVSHEPVQGRAATPIEAGRVWRLPRKKTAGPLGKLLRIETIKQARLIRRALNEAAATADVLHLHSNGLIVEVAAAWAARRIPYILTLYGTEIWHFKRRRPIDPFARAFERAAAVTYYSRKLMEHAITAGLKHPQGRVVYPAIGSAFAPQDETARASLRAALGIEERRLILNVKRLHELAGQQYLIEAFARMARGRSDVRLVICGTGPLRDSLQTLAKDRGVDDRVTFAGLVDNTVVAQYAAAADVFALPSLLEALPTVAVEALASGTPVVSADHPGGIELHELFGEDVRVVPKTNVDRLAEGLSDAIDHPRRVSAATLALTRRHFSLPAVTDAYAALYESSLDRKHQ